jgi:hypothetical protein
LLFFFFGHGGVILKRCYAGGGAVNCGSLSLLSLSLSLVRYKCVLCESFCGVFEWNMAFLNEYVQ